MVPVEVCMIVCLSGTCVVSVTSKLYLAIRTWGISATCLTVLLQIRYCYFFSFLFFYVAGDNSYFFDFLYATFAKVVL